MAMFIICALCSAALFAMFYLDDLASGDAPMNPLTLGISLIPLILGLSCLQDEQYEKEQKDKDKEKEKEVYKKVVGNGGLNGYLGTNDMRNVMKMAETDEKAALVRDAFIMQVARHRFYGMCTGRKDRSDHRDRWNRLRQGCCRRY